MWIYGSGFPKSLNIGKAIDKKLGNERKVVGTRVMVCNPMVMQMVVKQMMVEMLWGKESTEVELTNRKPEYEGWGTAQTSTRTYCDGEPLEGTNIDNVLKYGTGGNQY